MKIQSDAWLTLTAAARAGNFARATLMAAIWRGDVPAYCARCHAKLSVASMKQGHLCRLAPTGVERLGHTRFPIRLRWREVRKYSVSPSHHLAGLASARSRARKRRMRVA